MKNPGVSLIVPCYNEQTSIGLLLEAIRRQTCRLDENEVIIADGMSTDGTREAIRDYASHHPELSIRLIDNPQRIIPSASHPLGAGDTLCRISSESDRRLGPCPQPAHGFGEM